MGQGYGGSGSGAKKGRRRAWALGEPVGQAQLSACAYGSSQLGVRGAWPPGKAQTYNSYGRNCKQYCDNFRVKGSKIVSA